ncbi:MAG: Uma2 family endonuclease [Leptospiraceae bacterium]|nr:Uma2 family endonuclease [Leptospiraceae bacterium]
MTTALLQKSDIDLTQIINGVEIMAPSPFGIHQRISYNLTLEIGLFLRNNPIGTLFTAPLDVILDPKINQVQPDLIFIKKENMGIFHEHGWIRGVPDLLIEVVSKGTITRDTEEKYEIYQKYGVSEYWLVFPEQQCIEIYTLENSIYVLYSSSEKTNGTVVSKILTNFELDANLIF